MTLDCVFCKMFRGEVDIRKIYAEEDVLGILDMNPRMGEGQCLLIPRRHVYQFYELSDEEIAKLFRAVKTVALKIKKVFNTDIVSIFTRGQLVPHAHIIVSPAFKTDFIITSYMVQRLMQTFEAKIPESRLDHIAEEIRKA